MKIARVMGSWPAIAAVPALCVGAQLAGVSETVLTYTLSVAALTFTQLVLREQNKDSAVDASIQREQLNLERDIAEKVKKA